jgi:serine O-acetyltransferase
MAVVPNRNQSAVDQKYKDLDPTLRGADLIRRMGLINVLKEDFRTHRKRVMRPGFQAVVVYRLGTWAMTIKPRLLALPVKIFHRLAHTWVRNFYGIELAETARVGRRLEIGHQSGIVIHEFANIGNDVIIRQCVTFGAGSEWIVGQGPTIGDRTEFSPGAVVIGNVTIGSDVSVGPNCTVSTDVPSGRTLFMPAPRSFPKQNLMAAEADNDKPAN